MKKILKTIIGLSPASLIRGIRLGWTEFVQSAQATTTFVQPHEFQKLHLIPVRTFEDILGGNTVSISLPVQAHIDGSMPSHEAIVLLTIAVMEQPDIVLEIGTFQGRTTLALAMNLPVGTIHTLDLPLNFDVMKVGPNDLPKDDFHLIAARGSKREFAGSPYAERIREHFGDSATWDFQNSQGATFFLIDGSHTYEYCLCDTQKCFALCNEKGTFLWHDCDSYHPGVVRAILELRRQGYEIIRIAGTRFAYWKNS